MPDLFRRAPVKRLNKVGTEQDGSSSSSSGSSGGNSSSINRSSSSSSTVNHQPDGAVDASWWARLTQWWWKSASKTTTTTNATSNALADAITTTTLTTCIPATTSNPAPANIPAAILADAPAPIDSVARGGRAERQQREAERQRTDQAHLATLFSDAEFEAALREAAQQRQPAPDESVSSGEDVEVEELRGERSNARPKRTAQLPVRVKHEDPDCGLIRCPECRGGMLVSERGCNVVTCRNQHGVAGGWFYFCFHCRSELHGDMYCQLCPERNDHDARQAAKRQRNELASKNPIVLEATVALPDVPVRAQRRRASPAAAAASRTPANSGKQLEPTFAQYGDEVVHRRVEIRWTGDRGKPWFAGVVEARRGAMHLVRYDDGGHKEHHLGDEETHKQLRWI